MFAGNWNRTMYSCDDLEGQNEQPAILCQVVITITQKKGDAEFSGLSCATRNPSLSRWQLTTGTNLHRSLKSFMTASSSNCKFQFPATKPSLQICDGYSSIISPWNSSSKFHEIIPFKTMPCGICPFESSIHPWDKRSESQTQKRRSQSRNNGWFV